MLSTGSAELNQSSPSADLEDQATPSASEEQSTPSGQTRGVKTSESQVSRTFQLDPTGTFVEDELVVKFKKDLPQAAKEGILSLHQTAIIKEYPRTKVTLIKVEPAKREQITRALSQNPNIEYVHENQAAKLQDYFGGGGGSLSCYPNDYLYCLYLQWGLDKIQADQGWQLNNGSSSTQIAVIDSGVDYNHSDLGLSANGGKVIKGPDLVADDGDPMDENGHGTQVAGIIAAKTNNATSMAGINWDGKILAIRVTNSFGIGFEADVAEAIFEADARGAQVINLSLSFANDNPTLKNAVTVALANGRTLVAAVNQSTTTNCFMEFPAAYSGVLSVTATDINDNWASGCTGYIKNGTYYQGILVSAPGKDIYTLKRTNTVGSVSGTSFAAAFVSGVASILRSCTSSTNTYYDILFGSDDLGRDGYDSTYGYGRLNLHKALLRHCS